jgi:hypothetical protein
MVPKAVVRLLGLKANANYVLNFICQRGNLMPRWGKKDGHGND